jgi:uncharacterized protein (DUF1684 family)
MLQNTRRNTLATAFAFVVTTIGSLLIAPPAPAGENTAAYEAGIDEWHRGRIERLKRPDGYLSLVGLYLLEPGENRFGSSENNDLVFPPKAPEYAGRFVYEKGEVRIKVNAGIDITVEDEPVSDKRLKTDAENPTTILQMGTFHFFVIERAERLYIRLKDTESKALAEFTGIDRFPVSEAWRITGRFEPYNPPKQLRVPNVLGYEFEQTCPGRVVFEVGGQTCTLEPTSVSGNRLFFVFGDGTSTVETYGGGRFMVTDGPQEDGTVVLDFNKAYNPPCAFTPYATCPLPHADNLLDVRIEAGELNYGELH